MQFQVFSIPVFSSEEALKLVNNFCNEHMVVDIERQFVPNAASSSWTLLICHDGPVATMSEEPGPTSSAPTSGSSKVDYRDKLSKGDFTIYSRIRELRKNISDEEGVPPYAIFKNQQLADMVTGRLTTAAQIAKIPGVGPARTEKYAARFLEILAEEFAKLSPSVATDNKGG